jgi:hypothetical protein
MNERNVGICRGKFLSEIIGFSVTSVHYARGNDGNG